MYSCILVLSSGNSIPIVLSNDVVVLEIAKVSAD